MSISTPGQTNFTGGEWSARLDGRVDQDKYYNALKTLENMTVFPHGGATRRMGTEFIYEAGDGTKAVRLIPFEFNTEQAYILEFGDHYMRVYRDGGIVLSGASPYKLTTPYAAEDLNLLRFVQSADTMYIVHEGYEINKLTRTDHDEWSIDAADMIFWPMLAENTTSVTLAPSATSGAAVTVTAAPNAKAITGCANNGAGLIRVTCTAHGFTTGTKVLIASVVGTTEANGTWIITKISADTFDLRNSTFTNAYSSGGTASASVFAATDVGRAVGIKHSSTWGQGIITAVTNAYTATVAVIVDFGGTGAVATWALGAFSKTTGYPRTVSFYEERLVFGGTPTDPQTLFFSKSNNYEDFTPGTDDDSGMVLSIASDQVNAIRGMVSGKSLLVMTSGGEWTMNGGREGDALTPTSLQATRQSTYGCAEVQPILIGTAAVYVQRSGRKLREMAYVYTADAYLSPDLTLLCEHFGRSPILQMSYAPEPDSTIYAVREDGTMIALTYLREQEVVAGHRHITDGLFESVASIPGVDGSEVWVVVNRTIGGAAKRYIERIKPNFDGDASADLDCWFVDCGLSYDGRNTNSSLFMYLTASGASWAAGATGTIIASGGAPFTGGSVNDVYSVQDVSLDAYTIGQPRGMVRIDTVLSSNAAECSFLTAIPDAVQSKATPNWALMADEISGLSHLVGETVSIMADGAVEPNQIVSSGGSVDISRNVSIAIIGLPYTSKLQTMRMEAGSQRGLAQGKRKVITGCTFRLYKTLGGRFGTSVSNAELLPWRVPADLMGAAPALFTGDKELFPMPGGWNRDGFVYLEQSQPLPLTVTMIVATMAINE